MTVIHSLVTDAVDLVKQTQAGIHPAETQHHIKKLSDHLDKVKQMIHYIQDLQLVEQDHKCGNPAEEVTAINIRLTRDRRSLWQMNNHLQAAIAHLQGHDWGIFRK